MVYMPRSGEATRQNILDTAQGLILQHGFAGASIERIINGAHITKGAFFHHFPNKAALAEAVIGRFIDIEATMFNDICRRAERLSDDPVQRVLNILELYADALDSHPEVVDGCLYASVALQRGEFPDTVTEITAKSIEQTTALLRPYFEAAITAASPKRDCNADALADMFVCVGEGAFILAGLKRDPSIPGQQFRALKSQWELLLGR